MTQRSYKSKGTEISLTKEAPLGKSVRLLDMDDESRAAMYRQVTTQNSDTKRRGGCQKSQKNVP